MNDLLSKKHYKNIKKCNQICGQVPFLKIIAEQRKTNESSFPIKITKFTLTNNITIVNLRYNINNNDCLLVHIANIKRLEVCVALAYRLEQHSPLGV